MNQMAKDLPVPEYNRIMRERWPEFKASRNLSGDLHTCEHCERLYIICCGCETAMAKWDAMIDGIRAVQDEQDYDSLY